MTFKEKVKGFIYLQIVTERLHREQADRMTFKQKKSYYKNNGSFGGVDMSLNNEHTTKLRRAKNRIARKSRTVNRRN